MASGKPEANYIGYYDTLLMYHLGIDPRGLDDVEWAMRIKQLEHIRKKEAK